MGKLAVTKAQFEQQRPIAVQFPLTPMLTALYPTEALLITYAWKLCIQVLQREYYTPKSITYDRHEIVPHAYMDVQQQCRVTFLVTPYESE